MIDYCLPHSKLRCEKCTKQYNRNHDWGIFIWEAENRYRRENAVKVYRRRGTAEKALEKLEGNYVIRPLEPLK